MAREVTRTKLGKKQEQVLAAMSKGNKLIVTTNEEKVRGRQTVAWEEDVDVPAPPYAALEIYVNRGWLTGLKEKTSDGVSTQAFKITSEGESALQAHYAAEVDGESTPKTKKKTASKKGKKKTKKKTASKKGKKKTKKKARRARRKKKTKKSASSDGE